MAKKTYGISLNDVNPEDAALMAALEERGNASAVIRAALKLLLWGEESDAPTPTIDPSVKVLTEILEMQRAMIEEQKVTRLETVNAIRSIQVVLPIGDTSHQNGNGNGANSHPPQPESELESDPELEQEPEPEPDAEDPEDDLVKRMAGISFQF